MKNYLLYIITLISLSQAANIARYAAAPPEVMGFWRLVGAALLILPLALKMGDLRQSLKEHPRSYGWVLLSALFFFLHLWTYMYAAQNTKIANAMILFATNPLSTAVGAFFFFKEKFTPRLAIAHVFAFAAIFILVSGNLDWHSAGATGDISAIFSALFFSGYILFSKKARQTVNNTSYAFVKYLFTGLFFGGAVLYRGIEFTGYPSHAWIGILLLILVPTFMGHALVSYLMKYLNVNWMSCGKLLEPGIAAIIAYFFFGETLTHRSIAAFALTSIAILILFMPLSAAQLRKVFRKK